MNIGPCKLCGDPWKDLHDGLCFNCIAKERDQLRDELRITRCALVDLKCKLGEAEKEAAVWKARARE